MFKKSIIKKFMFLYLVVGISSLSLIGFYSYFKAKNALIMRATEQLNSVRTFKKVQIENYLNKQNQIDSDFSCDTNKNKKLLNVNVISLIMLDTNQTNGLGKSGEVYLAGDDFLMKSKSRFYPDSIFSIKVETQAVKNAFMYGKGSVISNDYRNILCLGSYDRLNVKGLNWVIVAEIDYQEAMIPIVNLRKDLIFASLIILILIFSIAQVITSDIIVPIVKLKNAALKISDGNFDAKVDIQSENEFGVLAQTFNQMIDNIQKNTSELVDEKAKRVSALYDGQEFERNRIARELHDGLAQELIAVKMTLENLISKKEFLNENKINDLKSQINNSIDELRKISYDLSPSGIMEFSFETALKNLCNQTQRNTGIQIDFSWFGNFQQLTHRTKIYLYRIVQEALNNTIKHAGATQIQIQLTETTKNLVLIIEDNGKGFCYDANNLGLGKGLLNMRERSILLNGTFDVETFPGKGTTIRVKVNKTS